MSPRKYEDEKENEDDFNNLKNMLAGMNIGGKPNKNIVKKADEEDEFANFNAQNFRNLIPDTPINTQIGDVNIFLMDSF